MKILIFGGSFDPVHPGHVKLLSAAVKAVRPDRTHVVPTFHSPFKAKTATPFNARMAMTKAAFSHIKTSFVFDDFELKRAKKTYAWQVIAHIKKTYPGAETFLLIGSDCVNEINMWKNAPYIFESATIVFGTRAGHEKIMKPDFSFVLLDGSFPLLSSTALRLKIMQSGRVPAELKNIKDIIEREGLYFLNIHAFLKTNLKSNRYLHTLAVTELIITLAEKYGIKRQDAILAALLHDAAKGLTSSELVEYAKKYNVHMPYLNLVCRYEPELLHSYVSADIAQRNFGVKDKEILRAVALHTLGGKKMSELAKILYVADASSKDRKFGDAAKIRALAREDLQRALIAATKMKLRYSIETNKWLCPEGNKTWNRLILGKE